METKVLTSNEKSIALEAEIFGEVRRFVSTKAPQIQQTADAVSMLDFIASLSEVAAENRYVCPDITMDGRVQIKNGRHPVVEQMLRDCLLYTSRCGADHILYCSLTKRTKRIQTSCVCFCKF